MKPFISVLIAVIIAFFGMTVVSAQEDSYAEQTVAEEQQENDNQNTEGEDEAAETALSSEPPELADEVKSKVVESSDGRFKLYVFDDGNLAYADIIKYIGKDSFPKNYKITSIDGYKIRQIRSKAFSKLKTLRNVTFYGTIFSSKQRSSVLKDAFYNCKKMASFTTSSFVSLKSKSVGFVNGQKSAKFKRITFNDKTATQKDVSAKLSYTSENSIKAIFNVSKNNTDNRKAKLVDFVNGSVFYAKVAGKSVKGWKSSNPKAISITSGGKAVILAKGKTTLSVKRGKLRIKRVFVVKTNPYLSINKNKATKVTVKNGRTVSVTVKGKAAGVDNVYTNTGYAKFTSETNTLQLKIKGTRRGSTTLKVKVNGVTLKLKVVIEKNPIPDARMAAIAEKIGHQSQYYYDESDVMCSAYAFAYCYYQVTGKKLSAGSVWCAEGCTWIGGTYTHYGSKKQMLKAIKASLDKNQACVGLLSIGNSSKHYVAFYDYNGNGTKLSDFKILDPWDGNLATGDLYGYSYGYHVVTVDT